MIILPMTVLLVFFPSRFLSVDHLFSFQKQQTREVLELPFLIAVCVGGGL